MCDLWSFASQQEMLFIEWRLLSSSSSLLNFSLTPMCQGHVSRFSAVLPWSQSITTIVYSTPSVTIIFTCQNSGKSSVLFWSQSHPGRYGKTTVSQWCFYSQHLSAVTTTILKLKVSTSFSEAVTHSSSRFVCGLLPTLSNQSNITPQDAIREQCTSDIWDIFIQTVSAFSARLAITTAMAHLTLYKLKMLTLQFKLHKTI